MPRTRRMSPQFFKAGLNEIIRESDNKPSVWKTLAKVVTTDDLTYNYSTESGLPPASEINEATGIPYEDFATPFNGSSEPVKRGIGFSCSWEWLNTKGYNLMGDRGRRMARSIEKTREADIAGFMNLGGSTLTTPDGVAIFSASHLISTGFFSNIVTSNPALSIGGLETAIGELLQQVDYTGDPTMTGGSYTLFVHPANYMLAQRLTGANKVPQSNNNDPNPAGELITRVVQNPYFTNPLAWLLVSNEENPFAVVQQGGGVRTYTEYDMDKDVHKFSALASWSKFARHPQGLIYSSGAGA